MSENLSKKEQMNIEDPDNRRKLEEDETEVAEAVGAETAEAVREVVVEAMRGEFRGPIPPPSIIKGYEEVVAGSADRIIKMAENQAAHRQEMERKMIRDDSRDSLLGIIFAFILGIGCIIAAVVMVVLVPQNAGAIAGSVIGVTGIGAITTGFIRSAKGESSRSSKSRKKESQNNKNSD